MKKHKKVIICAASAILTGAVMIFCLFCYPVFPRIYLGNRIKGDLTITCDGMPYELTSDQLISSDKIKEIEVGKYHIELKGGNYGNNPLEFLINPETLVEVNFFHSNWWYATKFNLNINIDTYKNEITYKVDYNMQGDSGCFETKQTIGKEKLELRIGSP